MNTLAYLSRISALLSRFTEQVKINNKNGKYDINSFAENIVKPLLNIIFDANLENVNFEEKENYPAIDLRDKRKKLSVQVTSDKNINKIKGTIEKFFDHKLHQDYEHIYHFIITEKQKRYSTTAINECINRAKAKNKASSVAFKFDPSQHVLDKSDIRYYLEREDNIDKIKSVLDFLEKHLADQAAKLTFEQVLEPYEEYFFKRKTHSILEDFDSTFFGREDDFEKIDTFIQSGRSLLAFVTEGGYGKTRLCYEYFKQIVEKDDTTEAYVLSETNFQSIAFSNELQSEKKILVLFDDAHKHPHILNEFCRIIAKHTNVKAILTIRKALYDDTIKSISTHNRQIEKYCLERLSYQHTQSIFKEYLPGLDSIEISKLAKLSKGVPLVILTLCKLLQQGKSLLDISGEDNFSLFVEQLVEQAVQDTHNKTFLPTEHIIKVIQAISLLGPVKNENSELSLLSQLLKIELEDVSLIISHLHKLNFIEKNAEISIKPNPYNDVLLLKYLVRIRYLLLKEGINPLVVL